MSPLPIASTFETRDLFGTYSINAKSRLSSLRGRLETFMIRRFERAHDFFE
jgi:hypothetical protein